MPPLVVLFFNVIFVFDSLFPAVGALVVGGVVEDDLEDDNSNFGQRAFEGSSVA